MAKGLRSRVQKANRSRLRSTVFGPVEDARKQRLSTILLSKATEPSPNARENTMLVDASEILPVEPNTSTTNDDSSVPAGGTNEGLQSILRYGSDHQDRSMELDPPSQTCSAGKEHAAHRSKTRKTRRGKTRSAMVFPLPRRGKSSGIRKGARSKKFGSK